MCQDRHAAVCLRALLLYKNLLRTKCKLSIIAGKKIILINFESFFRVTYSVNHLNIDGAVASALNRLQFHIYRFFAFIKE